MLKQLVYYLRSVLRLSLVSVMIFSIILCSTFIEADAAEENVSVNESVDLQPLTAAEVESFDFDISEDLSLSGEKIWGGSEQFSTDSFDLVSDNLDSNSVYRVKVGFNAFVRSDQHFNMYHTHVKYGGLSLGFFKNYTSADMYGIYFSGYQDITGYGREFKDGSLSVASYFMSNVSNGLLEYEMKIDLDVVSVDLVSSSSAYDDGYSAGYDAAINSGSSTEEETFEIKKDIDFAFDYLSVDDANTLLTTVFDYEQYEESTDERKYDAYFYHATAPQFVFTPSKEYYGYKVALVPLNISYSGNDMVRWVRPVLGSYADIFSGRADMGYDLGKTTSRTSNLWIDTAYSEEDVYLSVMGYFREVVSYATLRPEGGVGGSFIIRITPYTFDEYESAVIESQNRNNELLQEGNTLTQEGNEIAEEQLETEKGILSKITDFFNSFFQNFINSVVHLIVPTSEELLEWFDRVLNFLLDHLGFIGLPIDLVSRLAELFLSNNSNTVLTFPGFEIMGYTVWDPQDVDLYGIISSVGDGSLLDYLQLINSFIVVIALLRLAYDKFNQFIGGTQE